MASDGPGISQACRSFDTGVAASSDPDRRTWLLHRFQRHAGTLEPEMLAIATHLIFSPQALEQRQGFLKTGYT
jgi:hypothetical protein